MAGTNRKNYKQDPDAGEDCIYEEYSVTRDLPTKISRMNPPLPAIKKSLTKTISPSYEDDNARILFIIKVKKVPLVDKVKELDRAISDGFQLESDNNDSRNNKKVFKTLYDSYINIYLRKIESVHGYDSNLYFKYKLNFFYLCVMIFGVFFVLLICPYYSAFWYSTSSPYIEYPKCLNGTDSTILNSSMDITQYIVESKGFFYGSYNIEAVFDIYPLPVAYFACYVFSTMLSLIFIMQRLSKFNVRTFSLNTNNIYSKKLIGGYRFGVISKDDAKANLFKVENDFETVINHFKKKEISAAGGKTIKLIRISVWLISLGYYCVTFFIIYLSLKSIDVYKNLQIFQYVVGYIPSTLLTVLKIIYESLISYLIKKEMYSAASELSIYMIRQVLFFCLSIVVLVKDIISNTKNLQCWESALGYVLINFIVVQFVFDVLVDILSVLRGELIVRVKRESRFHISKIGKAKFSVAPLLLNLFVDQTMVWIGTFFCPWIPLIIAYKHLITLLYLPAIMNKYYNIELLHHNTYTLKYLCDKSLCFFYIFYIALLGYIFSISNVSNCGPFGAKTCSEKANMNNKFMAILYQTFRKIPSDGFNYLFSTSFMFILLNILCMIISEMINRLKFHKMALADVKLSYKIVVEENRILKKNR